MLRVEVVYPNLVCPISVINVMRAFAKCKIGQGTYVAIVAERHLHHTHQNNAQLKMDMALSVDRNTQTLALEP